MGTVDDTGANDRPGSDANGLAAWACAALSAASWRSLSTAGRSSSTRPADAFFCVSSWASCAVRAAISASSDASSSCERTSARSALMRSSSASAAARATTSGAFWSIATMGASAAATALGGSGGAEMPVVELATNSSRICPGVGGAVVFWGAEATVHEPPAGTTCHVLSCALCAAGVALTLHSPAAVACPALRAAAMNAAAIARLIGRRRPATRMRRPAILWIGIGRWGRTFRFSSPISGDRDTSRA